VEDNQKIIHEFSIKESSDPKVATIITLQPVKLKRQEVTNCRKLEIHLHYDHFEFHGDFDSLDLEEDSILPAKEGINFFICSSSYTHIRSVDLWKADMEGIWKVLVYISDASDYNFYFHKRVHAYRVYNIFLEKYLQSKLWTRTY